MNLFVKFFIMPAIIAAILPTIAYSGEKKVELPLYNSFKIDNPQKWEAGLESKTGAKDVASGFRQCYSSEHKVVEEQTSFKITYDAKNLYLQVHCDEPQIKNLKTTVTQRDGKLWNDDCVEIFISKEVKGRPYYQFIVNSAGALFDSSSRKGEKKGWNSDTVVKVAKGSNWWGVLLAIPWIDLGIKDPDASQIRANICRTRRVTGGVQLSAWSPTEKGYHAPERFGYVIFGSLKDSLMKSWLAQAPVVEKEMTQINRKLEDNPTIKAQSSEKFNRLSKRWKEFSQKTKAAPEHMPVPDWEQFNQELSKIVLASKQLNIEIDFEIVLQ
jgi:cellulose/xylan binding protein with CBM9 domain